tara:strand:- start:3573 stop:4259 length:687 start_codon:yes stop_codon:yes gene_type:complete
MFTKIKAVRVQEVIMSGSANIIGGIRFDDLNKGKPISSPPHTHLPYAKPLFNNISQYPTVNEIVYILGGPKDTYNYMGDPINYYLPPLNINGSANHNALPNQLTQEEIEAQSETSLDYFQERDIRPLLPYLGDITIEGRYGNSIRFGSTISGSHQPNNWSNEGQPGNPITIIRNGQRNELSNPSFEHILEDVNTDNSSIYLCSNQQITNFQKAGIYPKEHPASYKHML